MGRRVASGAFAAARREHAAQSNHRRADPAGVRARAAATTNVVVLASAWCFCSPRTDAPPFRFAPHVVLLYARTAPAVVPARTEVHASRRSCWLVRFVEGARCSMPR